jgi:Fe-S-cluster-containing dehydrogenase component
MDACPYSSKDMKADGAYFTVISYNPFDQPSDPFYSSNAALIPGCSSSPAEVASLTGGAPPNRHEYTHPDYRAVRRPDVTEKCTMCDHRQQNGEQPYCVNCCPADARIFGDIDDPNSEVSKLLREHTYFRLKNNKGDILQPGENGTRPNVYYIRSFENVTTPVDEEPKPEVAEDSFKIYPNPAREYATLELALDSPEYMDCSIYNIAGQKVASPVKHEFMLSGTSTVQLSLNDLTNGTYIVQVSLGRLRNSKRLIIQK